jgi:glycine/D-amino acid oxidase-like deaminating enzyme
VDVVVVGSGIVGAFAAWRLLQDAQDNGLSGARSNVQNVLMLEAREACWGATGRVGSLSLWVVMAHRFVDGFAADK